ncbi:MAG: ShlB/FhaC/HecB family hemolysin secretion/activation protein, partial [Phascolarctobacterium sp.]|nr:ShlB/FhaC/HecB family hemolysin secretion/activation protein [Phascolarctobacterium sp.]
MLKSLQSKILLAVMIGSTLMSSVVYANTGAPDPMQVSGFVGADPGVQLNRSREYMERERVARQIAEDQARRNQKVEDKNQAAEQKEVAVKFELKDLKVDKSEVLTEAEIEKIAKKYIGNEVNIKDLYRIVEKINKLYSKKGYLTCRAYLPPQTIKDGVVQIKLIEGKTGNVTVQGNKTTQTDYIEDRVHLTKGKIDNVNELNKDLLLYNATHDAQLRISMQAGEAPGTTDYVITSYEPQQHVV